MGGPLHIGTTCEHRPRELHIDADVQTLTTAILGIRGSGKTNTAGVIVEGLLALDRQILVIDPTDAWWGLRHSADGKRPGFPVVVCGGPQGQLPLREQDGATFANFVATRPATLILSLRHLRKGAQRRFVTEFAEQLYHRKGERANARPVLIVIDECDLFIPQRVAGGEARMVGSIEDLVRRGRLAGIGVMLISQRAASINKDVLTQIELLVAHRHTSPQDRAALREWVRAHDTEARGQEFEGGLAALGRGEAWFWSPSWLDLFVRAAVKKKTSYDSSATPSGARFAAPTAADEVDLDALRAELGEAIAEADAIDPRKLRARIAELEREIAQAARRTPAVPAVAPAALKRIDTTAERLAVGLTKLTQRLEAGLQELRGMTERLVATIERLRPIPDAATSSPRLLNAPAIHAERDRPSDAGGAAANGELSAYARELLRVLIDRSPHATTEAQLSTLSGKSRRSSQFDAQLRHLTSRGLVERHRGSRGAEFRATAAAAAHFPGYVPPPAAGPVALQDWLRKLAAYERLLLEKLAASWPEQNVFRRCARSSHPPRPGRLPTRRFSGGPGHVRRQWQGFKARPAIPGPRTRGHLSRQGEGLPVGARTRGVSALSAALPQEGARPGARA
ncbi:MAG: ATP-binding protein [Phycisphaerae bacterium]|jgi:hypothetical protein